MRLINGRFQMFVAYRSATHKWPIFLNFMEIKHFYFISDQFFKDFQDRFLTQNKEDEKRRPCFFAVEDDEGLFWMIPISSKVQKYKLIYNQKLAKNGKCDTIVFAKVLGQERAFLIQNMFPVIDKYISGEYFQKGSNNPVMISEIDSKMIIGRFKRVFALIKNGNKNLAFPDVLRLANLLKEQL